MQQRLLQALVGILVLDVLADQADGRPRRVGIFDALEHGGPAARGRAAGVSMLQQARGSISSTPSLGENQRDFVDGLDVARRDHGLDVDVAEQRDLLLHLLRQMKRSERQSRISGWIPMARSSFTLCWVGLVFSSCAAAIHGTSVTWTKMHVVAALFVAHLADGFEERQRFDIADRAADLDDHHVHIARTRLRQAALISLVTCGITCTVLPR